MGVIGRWKT